MMNERMRNRAKRIYVDAAETDNRKVPLAKLAESKDLHSETVDQLRTLMAVGKKPKADEIVKVFQHPGGGDIK